MQGVEPILDAFEAYLVANLPTQVAAVNLTYAADPRGIVLDDIAAEAIVVGGQKPLYFPWLELAIPTVNLTNLSLAQLRADVSPLLVMRLAVNDAAGNAYRRAMRYTTALAACALNPDAFAGLVYVDAAQGLRIRWQEVDLETASGGSEAAMTAVVVAVLTGDESRL